MEYENYTSKDFAADEDFIKWVKHPNTELDLFWNQWLQANPSKQIIVAEARQFVQLFDFRQYPETSQRMKAVWERIELSTQSAEPKMLSKVRQLLPIKLLWQNWNRVAAVFIGALLMSPLLFLMIKQSQTIEYQTAFGETRTIQLPDGSQVILNANSTLGVKKNWKTDRDVWLSGEAFFSVREKPVISAESGKVLAKFTVHTSQASVQVLGTQFNVSDRSENTTVVLHSGKINLKLENQKDTIRMQPGELVTYNRNEEKTTRKVVNPKVYIAWKDKEWILENQTLADIAARIEETYGVEVTIADPRIANETVSGVVPTASLPDLLNALSASLDIKISQNQKQIIIRE